MAACKYNSHVKDRIPTIIAWKRKGLTDEEIAENLGIGTTAMKTYKKKYAAMASALKSGKSDADAQVENALFKRAIGYEFDSAEQVEVTDEDGTSIVRKKTWITHIKPDVAAMIFYLKNRISKEWQDRRNVGISDPDGKPLDNVHFLLPDNGMDDGDGK